MEQPYERVKTIRQKLNMNQTEFAEKIKIAQSTLGQIEKGTRRLTERVANDICREHNVNKEYLLYGKGEMFAETPSSILEQLKKEFKLDDFSSKLIYEYLKLNENQRKTIRDFFNKIVDNENAPEEISVTQENIKGLTTEFIHKVSDAKNNKANP